MFNTDGLRKVILGVIVMLIGVLVDSFSKNGLSQNLMQLLIFVSSGFFLGNSLEHFSKKGVEKSPKGIDELQSQLKVISEQVAVNQQQAAYIIEKAFGMPQK